MTAISITSANTQVNVAPITCNLSNLRIESAGPNPDDILKVGEAFRLLIDVTFAGAGAAALMALAIPVRVCWAAESYGPNPEFNLGCATVSTSGGVFSYTVELLVSPNPLSAEVLYRIGATLRVGSPAFPALVNGYAEGGAIEMYNP